MLHEYINTLLNNESIKLLKKSLTLFIPYKKHIIASFIFLAFVSLCTAGSAYLVQPALDKIFINKNKEALLFIPLLLIGIFATKGFCLFGQKFLMSYSGIKVIEHLRYELYAKIICLPVAFFSEARVGMLMSRITNDVSLISASMPEIIRLTQHTLTVFGLTGVVIYQDPFLAFWACVVFPLAVYPIVFFGKKLRKNSRKKQRKIADISSHLQESLNGLRVIKAFATEDQEKLKFKNTISQLVHLGIKGRIYNLLSTPIIELIGALGAGLVIWYGGSQVIEGHKTPGEFFSFLTALIMLYDPIKSIGQANNAIQQALAGAERVFKILDAEDLLEERGGVIEYKPPFKSLEFKNVTFYYPGSKDPALRNINLNVTAGERIALVGHSGSGKSTIANLIPLFYKCDQGQIFLNGYDVKEYMLHSLRTNIGIVAQDPFLFNLSIRDNIAYAQSSANMVDIEHAAKAAYAHDFIMELPDGYETIIGEKGVKLSGGQKQRLTIARAIMKNPSLLILDEATSALDAESELIVQSALENLMQNRTSIVIAHRLSTIKNASRILVMNKGTIEKIGTHDELILSSETYIKLHQSSF